MNFSDFLIPLVIAAAVLVSRLALINRWMFTYRVTDSAVEIWLFGRIRRKRIPFTNIADTEILAVEGPAWVAPLPGWYMTFEAPTTLRGPFVQLTQKHWRINRYVLISPDDPAGFVRDLSSRIRESKELATR